MTTTTHLATCFRSPSSLFHTLGSKKAWLCPSMVQMQKVKGVTHTPPGDSPMKQRSTLKPRFARASAAWQDRNTFLFAQSCGTRTHEVFPDDLPALDPTRGAELPNKNINLEIAGRLLPVALNFVNLITIRQTLHTSVGISYARRISSVCLTTQQAS